MREHSGPEGKNNNGNPTLKEHELAQGRNGEAIHRGEGGKEEKSSAGNHQDAKKSP